MQFAEVKVGGGLGLDRQSGGGSIAGVQEDRGKAFERGLGFRVFAEEPQAPGSLQPTERAFVGQIVETRDFDALIGQRQRAREIVSPDMVSQLPQSPTPRCWLTRGFKLFP
ncbi:MAG: hypothetical protein C0484_03140 [Rhodospirillum sp.]|nr:hypothetical protein [Rhodospirillum sp.]